MNYPLAKAALGFFVRDLDLDAIRSVGGYRDVRPLDAADFAAEVERVLGLYDPAVRDVQLNLLGSHDTPRFLTASGNDLAALEMAFLFLFTLPGAPCVYYGDEIGLEGGPDPDCRRAFPWDESSWDHVLRDHVKRLAALRHAHPALRRGSFRTLMAERGVVAFERADRPGRRRRRRVQRLAARNGGSTSPWAASGPFLVDAATGEELAVTDGRAARRRPPAPLRTRPRRAARGRLTLRQGA